jgi:hypothetical protein
MPLSYALDVQQGFSFGSGSHAAVGHLITAAVFGTALTADLTVTDPAANASTPAVGVLAQVQWGETPQAPLSLAAYVSVSNHSVLTQLEHQQISGTAVVVNFRVYEYDPVSRGYFVTFAPQQPPLHALVAKSGNTVQLRVSSTPLQVKSLQVYEVAMTLQPPLPQRQGLLVAESPATPLLKPWGG